MSQKLISSVGIGLLIMTAALSGCLVKEDDGEPAAVGAGTTSDDSASDANETSGPSAVLVISANGTELYSSANSTEPDSGTADNGTAPGNTTATGNTTAASGNATGAAGDNSTSNETAGGVVIEPGVNITFDASASEGTNLTFSWEIGNVTSENATFDHAFTAPGSYTINLTVTDADNATDEETVDIVVGTSGSGPASGSPAGDRAQTFTGAPTGGYYVGAPSCAVGGAQAESSFTWTILGVDETGSAIKAVKLMASASQGAAGVAHRLTIEDAEGNQLAQGTGLTVEGEFPAGDYTVIYRLCGPLSSAGTAAVTATASYVYG